MGFFVRSESSPHPAAATTPSSSTKWGLCYDSGALLEDNNDNNSSSDWPARAAAVRLSDNHLLHLALEATQSLDWTALSQPPVATTATTTAANAHAHANDWTPVKLKDPSVSTSVAATSASSHAAATRVLSRREGDHVVAVAHTVLPCLLQELTRVLDTATALNVLRVLHGDALVSAKCMQRVETTPAPAAATLSGLTVTAVAFAKRRRGASVLFRSASHRSRSSKRDEWCFVDFVQRISPRVVRKTLLVLPASSVLVDDDNKSSKRSKCNGGSSSGQPTPDVLAGYLFEEQDDGRATRVSFWGEHALQSRNSSRNGGVGGDGNALQRALVNRAGRARLLRLATSVDRFLLVVRRRRLGAQVLADDVQVRASNVSCTCCRRSLLLSRKRACSLCGYYVCDRCAHMEDRERRVRTSSSSGSSNNSGGSGASDHTHTVVTRVRICDLCVVRVDQCNYNSVTLEDLAPPRVHPDAHSPGATANATTTTTTGALLERVLRSAIERAPSTDRTPVRRIVQDLVSQSSPSSGTAADSYTLMPVLELELEPVSAPKLTDASSDEQHFAALQRTLGRVPVPAPDDCRLANAERRAYPIEHGADAGDVHPHPVSASEQRRLEIVRASRLTALECVAELEVICAIVSSELGCIGVMISISEADAFHVVATNIEALPARSFPRSDGFCSRTIMGADPMLVPHPEADVRFSYILPVKHLGVSFYCGFPLFADDFTVLGSMCCLGSATGELSQSQFVVGKKLAEMASRILQRQVALRTAVAAGVASAVATTTAASEATSRTAASGSASGSGSVSGSATDVPARVVLNATAA